MLEHLPGRRGQLRAAAPIPNSPYTISATTPGNYSGTITSKNQKGWATGVHTFTIWDVTTGSSTFVVKTFKICAAGVPTC